MHNSGTNQPTSWSECARPAAALRAPPPPAAQYPRLIFKQMRCRRRRRRRGGRAGGGGGGSLGSGSISQQLIRFLLLLLLPRRPSLINYATINYLRNAVCESAAAAALLLKLGRGGIREGEEGMGTEAALPLARPGRHQGV